MKRKWNLAIVEPCHLVCAGLAQIFSRTPFSTRIRCATMEQLWDALGQNKNIDLFLIDVEQSAAQFRAHIDRLKGSFPKSFIVFLSDTVEHDQVALALQADVHGYIAKTVRSEAVVKSLELIVLGERVFPAHALLRRDTHLNAHIAHDGNGHADLAQTMIGNLSSREIEVLRSLGEGKSNKEIARQLDISDATVKVHVKAILRKLRVKNRTKAALWIAEAGFADMPLHRH